MWSGDITLLACDTTLGSCESLLYAMLGTVLGCEGHEAVPAPASGESLCGTGMWRHCGPDQTHPEGVP